MRNGPENLDEATVRDFGREWARFDQKAICPEELRQIFNSYFAIFPWDRLPIQAVGFDAGCGGGRWAALTAPRVGLLHCIDASAQAVQVAKTHLDGLANVVVHEAPIDAMPLADGTMDFGYCIGVLQCLPDPAAGLAACVRKLKPGAPMLIYTYYAFDNRPRWFRELWRVSDIFRRAISVAPFWLKSVIAEVIAALVYWPVARAAGAFERVGKSVSNWPLSGYRRHSYYVMRNDALDRFGTRLEHRMTRAEIEAMMTNAGLGSVRFSESGPFWCAVGQRP